MPEFLDFFFAPKKASDPSVLRHYRFAESFITPKNSFGLHLVNDICYDLNGGDIKWAASGYIWGGAQSFKRDLCFQCILMATWGGGGGEKREMS